jgi:hypothetical protein
MIVKLSEICRTTLSEGRDYGVGYAFAKRLSLRTFEASQPLSACKDFLNDEVYCEKLKTSYTKYGQKSFYKDLFTDKYAYILVSFLNKNNCNKLEESEKYKKDLKYFNDNISNILNTVKILERERKLPSRSKLYKTNIENVYLIKLPSFWVRNTYLISLYTLLLRNSWNSIEKQDLKNYLKNNRTFSSDIYLLNNKVIDYLVKDFAKDENLSSLDIPEGCPHNKGFINYLNEKE